MPLLQHKLQQFNTFSVHYCSVSEEKRVCFSLDLWPRSRHFSFGVVAASLFALCQIPHVSPQDVVQTSQAWQDLNTCTVSSDEYQSLAPHPVQLLWKNGEGSEPTDNLAKLVINRVFDANKDALIQRVTGPWGAFMTCHLLKRRIWWLSGSPCGDGSPWPWPGFRLLILFVCAPIKHCHATEAL